MICINLFAGTVLQGQNISAVSGERDQDLLDKWEAARDLGICLSAEELCRHHPELLEEAKNHIRAIKAMDCLQKLHQHSCPSTDDSPERVTNDEPLMTGLEPVPGQGPN
jgi:hypothetical protein